jgi:hypothetical protein
VAGDVLHPDPLHVGERGAKADGVGDDVVPASNRAGAGWCSVRSKVTSLIMLPPPCHGGIEFSTSRFPWSTPIPVGPKTLWPDNAYQSLSSSCTSTGMRDTACAPSMRTRAP